jgi:hypothetical protein
LVLPTFALAQFLARAVRAEDGDLGWRN